MYKLTGFDYHAFACTHTEIAVVYVKVSASSPSELSISSISRRLSSQRPLALQEAMSALYVFTLLGIPFSRII